MNTITLTIQLPDGTIEERTTSIGQPLELPDCTLLHVESPIHFLGMTYNPDKGTWVMGDKP